MALVGEVNPEVVAALNRHGPHAVGISGADANLLTVEPGDERLGFVGDVRHVAPSILQRLLREELIPVVATVGVDEAGQAYNVNADTVAAAVAAALHAEKLVYLTDVAGVYRDRKDLTSLISEIDVADIEGMVTSGAIGDGMIPKVRSCIAAVRGGVHRVHILDGRVPHALLLEFFTREGIGTMIEAPRNQVQP
jgi:acetylglutamate kinase